MEPDYIQDDEEEYGGEAEELNKDDPDYEFHLIERNYTQTLNEIEGNLETQAYGDEFTHLFEKVYEYYTKYKQSDQHAMELMDDNQIIKEHLELQRVATEADKHTIQDQKKDIEHARKLADAAHSREQAAQETIDNLRRQVEGLNAEIDLRNKMAQDSSEELTAAASKKQQGLEREKERLMGEVTQMNMKLTNALEYQKELEAKNSKADLQIAEMNDTLDEQTNEIDRFKRQKEKFETEIMQLNLVIGDKDVEAEQMNNTIQMCSENIAKLEKQIREGNEKRDGIIVEYEATFEKLIKTTDDYKLCQGVLEKAHATLDLQNKEMKSRLAEIKTLRMDLLECTRMKDKTLKHISRVEAEKFEAIEVRNQLREHIGELDRQIADLNKKILQDKKETIELMKDKENLAKTLIKTDKLLKEQKRLINAQAQSKKKLEMELNGATTRNRKQLQHITDLQREREKFNDEILALSKAVEDRLSEIKISKSEVYELKKILTQSESRFKEQQNIFDVVRSERNAFEKALQECNAQSGQLKQKLKITVHQIDQLKEEISSKEQTLVQADTIYRKMLKEKEMLMLEVNSANEIIKGLKFDISEKDVEEKRLHKAIMQDERKIREQAKDIAGLMNERDILGSQVVRRNDEIALLNEKLEIYQRTLHQGEAQYNQRLEDIRLLKIEVKRLRQEKMITDKKMKNNVDLKKEVLLLERDLTNARLMCRALEEELQNPMNVHRWRKLEGSDPEALELLQKIRLLQKRLLRQSAEAIERERKLKQTEQLYFNLKQVLLKQPGPETQIELNKTQRALKKKSDHLKCLVSELNMAEYQAKEYKSEFQRCTEELNDIKRRYIALKKTHRTHMNTCVIKDSSHAPNQNIAADNASKQSFISNTKISGGGFHWS